MASLIRKPWFRLRVGGAQIELTGKPDNPTQNEALEGVITTVMDAEVLTSDALTTNVGATIYAVDLIAETMTAQFSGRVDHKSVQSYPNTTVLTSTGPLARLRRAPEHDHSLTGMDPKEAMLYILDTCNITVDPDDFEFVDYTFGEQVDVFWKAGQPGHEVADEINQVFGMALVEIGAGRVVWFAYDKAPSSSDISQTYTRGVDVEFWGNQEDSGNLDSIFNLFQVTGASWENDTNKCTYTVWAKGVADNDDLGGSTRNPGPPFSSDFIQDEALAGAIAERLLRWNNRQPNELTVRALNDQNVNCGDVIGVSDEANGMDLTDDPYDAPYLVLTIDRRGSEMTLNCVGGAAGDTGTITTGVEKKCNETVSTVDIPGLFTPPAIMTPPTIPVADWVCGIDGGPFGLCPDDDDVVIVADWVEDLATFNSTLTSATALYPLGTGHDEGHEIDIDADWTLTGTFETSSGGASASVDFGVCGTNPPFNNFIPTHVGRFFVVDYDYSLELYTRNVDDYLHIPNFDDSDPIEVVLTWTQSTTTLAMSVTQGARVETFSIVDPDPTDIGGPYFPIFLVIGGTGQAELTDYTVTP